MFDGVHNNLCVENSAGCFINVNTSSQVNQRELMLGYFDILISLIFWYFEISKVIWNGEPSISDCLLTQNGHKIVVYMYDITGWALSRSVGVSQRHPGVHSAATTWRGRRCWCRQLRWNPLSKGGGLPLSEEKNNVLAYDTNNDNRNEIELANPIKMYQETW